jgi:hypothetical protein
MPISERALSSCVAAGQDTTASPTWQPASPGEVEPRQQARSFLLGRLSDVDTRSCWQLAEQTGDPSPHAMQCRYTGTAGRIERAGRGVPGRYIREGRAVVDREVYLPKSHRISPPIGVLRPTGPRPAAPTLLEPALSRHGRQRRPGLRLGVGAHTGGDRATCLCSTPRPKTPVRRPATDTKVAPWRSVV